MKTKFLILALATLTIGLLGSCKKVNDSVPEPPKFPEGALPGEFTVNAEGKKVHFSQGNLWYGKVGTATTATWNFETNQYDSEPTGSGSWDPGHISHFYWTKTAEVACAYTYDDTGKDANDVFFTNETETTAKADFTVNGVTGKYRTLSKDEWVYLINKDGAENVRKGKYKYGVKVCEKANCLILAPDDFKGAIETSYDTAAWATAEAAGLVCLPAAGNRSNPYVGNVTAIGYYCSSTAFDRDNAYVVFFASGSCRTDDHIIRGYGISVRLIKESK